MSSQPTVDSDCCLDPIGRDYSIVVPNEYHFQMCLGDQSIVITTSGEVKLEGVSLHESGRLFWECVRNAFPGLNLKDPKEVCICSTQALMTGGCKCGHLKKKI